MTLASRFKRAIFVGLLAPIALHAQSPVVPPSVKPRIVLVHGASADGSYWQPVYRLLHSRGYTVTIVQNPLTGFDDDVAATRRVLELTPEPVVLVGHSYGGMVITAVGADPKVRALVYVAAHAPDVGESVADLNARHPLPPPDAATTADGYLYLKPGAWQHFVAADLSDETASFAAASQVLTAVSAFSAKARAASWRDKPTYAVVATQDRIVSPELQRFMYRRAGAQTVDVAASHSVHVSQPKAVVDIIVEAAAAAQKAAW